MLRIGLTGGLASGKTSVADLFAQYGAPIIDADTIAHDLTKPNTPTFLKIIQHFTNDIIDNNSLDRKKLRSIVFNHPSEKKWLESLLHPLIRQEIDKKMQNLKASYVIVVIPLLIETSRDWKFDRIIVVDTPETIQIERAIARDHLTAAEANNILQQQASREERLIKADDVIKNHGSRDELKAQVDKLHRDYTVFD